MARVNVEDSLFRDNRYLKLVIKTGSAPLALGLIVQAWIVAQKFYLSENHTIPLAEWKNQELSDLLIEVGLAEIIGDGVYMKGSDTQFGWLKQRVDAGRKGGKAKAEKKNPSKSSGRLAKASKSKQTEASSSFSSSSSFSYSSSSSSSDSKFLFSKGDEESSTDVDGTPQGGLIKNPIGFFIANYINAYQVRYGSNARPPLSGKVQGQIKRFISETPLQRACDLVQVFCQMSDPWFITKGHDFGTFVENQAKISLALDTGRPSQDEKNKTIDWEALGREVGAI